jgi:cobalt-zinc-cadmium efflux system membrane fusion protein
MTGKLLEERQSRREVAAARFRGVCEETDFQSRKELARAQADLESASRSLDISRDRLQTLLGPNATAPETDQASEFDLIAPISGRIEELETVTAIRFQAAEQMLVLADTRILWMAAQIHQNQWNALDLAAGQTLMVSIPALPSQKLPAVVKFVGGNVSAATLAVPLVAELNNTDGKLRPGMFVWVEVPMREPKRVLAIPVSAVQRQEDQAFAFIKEAERQFRRVSIAVGIETPEWVEVTSGLRAGDCVVEEGAFFLTSELLLEAEE